MEDDLNVLHPDVPELPISGDQEMVSLPPQGEMISLPPQGEIIEP